MKKFIYLCICLILLSLGIPGCQKTNSEALIVEEDKPEQLDVFLSGHPVSEYYVEDDRKNTFYTSQMAIGEYLFARMYGEQGFIFYDAIQKYQKQTGIEIKLHWYMFPEEMEAALASLEPSELPDLILSNNLSKADYYEYMKNQYFYDLTPFTEAEELYTGGAYYDSVLNAGMYQGKQYILPILFNIDTVMGNEEKWNALNLYFDQMTTFSEMMDYLLQAQAAHDTPEVVGQLISEMTTYTPYVLYAASGEKWIDYEKNEVNLDEATFRKMAEFYKGFLLEQVGEIEEGTTISWAYTEHMKAWRVMLGNAEEYLDDKGCIIEGGGGFQTYLHSALAQAWYYESRYSDMGRDFAMNRIPGENGGTTAHVSYFGGVMSNTEYPKAAYDFLRYLMDEEYFCGYGIPVNQANAEKMLEEFTALEYDLRSGLNPMDQDGNPYESVQDYQVHPMSNDTKEKLETYIEDISSVSLPNWPAYGILEEQLLSYGKQEISLEEAYDQARKQLEAYLVE